MVGRKGGFTLIEVLVAVGVLVFLMTAIMGIFGDAVRTINTQQARTDIDKTARIALGEFLANDLAGCVDFDSGRQRFILTNGGGDDSLNAQDEVEFVASTLLDNKVQTAVIRYHLRQSSDTRNQTGVRSGRKLYIMEREAFRADIDSVTGRIKKGPPLQSPTQLAEYVTSFNIEYLADNMNFSQLGATSPFSAADPLGDGLGANDPIPGDPSSTGFRIPEIRVTLIMVEGPGERGERVYTRVIKIPTG